MKDIHKENILFLVHVEEMFRQYFPDKMYVHRLIRACQAKKYDRVFLMISGVEDYQPIRELVAVTGQHQYINWSWGYEVDMFDDDEKQWIIPAYGHEWTWVPPELRDHIDAFKNANVFVGGGCKYECLRDFIDVLEYLEIGYEKINGYIY